MRTEVKKIELVRDGGVGCQVIGCIRWKSMLGGFGHWVVVLVVARSTPRFCDSLEGLRRQHIVVLTAMTYYSKKI